MSIENSDYSALTALMPTFDTIFQAYFVTSKKPLTYTGDLGLFVDSYLGNLADYREAVVAASQDHIKDLKRAGEPALEQMPARLWFILSARRNDTTYVPLPLLTRHFLPWTSSFFSKTPRAFTEVSAYLLAAIEPPDMC
jgi:hypothetical protein